MYFVIIVLQFNHHFAVRDYCFLAVVSQTTLVPFLLLNSNTQQPPKEEGFTLAHNLGPFHSIVGWIKGRMAQHKTMVHHSLGMEIAAPQNGNQETESKKEPMKEIYPSCPCSADPPLLIRPSTLKSKSAKTLHSPITFHKPPMFICDFKETSKYKS